MSLAVPFSLPNARRGRVQVGDLETDSNKTATTPLIGEQLGNATAPGTRPVHFISDSNPGADLIGEVVAAMAATSLVFQDIDAPRSTALLSRARFLYEWMITPLQSRTQYSLTNADFNATYPSSTPFAHMMLAAAWMNRRTKEEQFAQQALQFHGKARGLQVSTSSWLSVCFPVGNVRCFWKRHHSSCPQVTSAGGPGAVCQKNMINTPSRLQNS